MSADIVAATQALATSRDNKCDNPTVMMLGKEVVLNTAADLIESLKNDVFKYKALSESLKKECGRLMTDNDDLRVKISDVTARNERLSNDYSAYSGSALERADELIEGMEKDAKQLRKQLAEVTQLALEVTGKYETSVKMHQITNSALTASQARERAAVEMLKSANLCRQCAYDAQCGSTNHYRQQKRIYGHCDHWQWRGLQDVEEGK